MAQLSLTNQRVHQACRPHRDPEKSLIPLRLCLTAGQSGHTVSGEGCSTPVVPAPRAQRDLGTGTDAPKEFVHQVADALWYLHDVPRLQTHPLGQRFAAPGRRTDGVGRALQRALLDAMDGLRPARSGVPERSARIHRLLVLRYRDGLEPSAVRTLLGIGKSEYHREQTRGLGAVASLLWEQLSANQGRSRLQPTAETDAAHLALPRYARKVAGVLAQQPLW
jgi:hypothetical protein